MNRMISRVLSSIGAASLCLTASAAPPAAINVHGQLVGAGGAALSGARAYQVTFYDAATAGNALGAAVTGTVTVAENGLFNMAVTPPSAILTASEVWYALGVDTDVPADNDASDDVFPNRIRVYSVPFALQAQEVVGVDASRVGSGMVDNTELDALDGVTGNVQQQIDAIDTAAVMQHTTDIAANTSAIATNTTAIASNAGAITTNTTSITTNATAIATKANSADVYTQTAADSAFVDVTGDTMSGALGVNTISEATADSGVTTEGLLLKDSYLGFPQIAAPGDTSDKLYNVGGNLFFGSLQLGLASLDKDGINDAGTLGFDWLDSEVADALTIQGGTVDNDSFSAFSDLTAESKIGTGSTQVAAGDHSHMLQNLGGTATDAQVTNALTIAGGSVNNDSFSALSDLAAESAIGTSTGQVAAGDHDHMLQNLSGAVTDAQVPDNITITEADTLDTVAGRGATTDVNLVLNGATQTITYTQAAGTFSINSDSSNGMGVEGVTILNGDITSVGQVRTGDGTATAPATTFSGDTDTGMLRPGANQLAFATGGSSRVTIDDVEVNLSGNIMEIAAGTAPGTTTNKLYNTSGNLFWNGTQLNAGGGGTAVRYLSTLMPDDTDGPALTGPLDSIAGNTGFGISTSEIGTTRYTGFIPEPVTIVIQRAWVLFQSSFNASASIDIDIDARRNSDGVVQHTLAANVDPSVGSEAVWQEITLPVAEADRTVEPTEYVAITYVPTSTATSGTYNVFVKLQISDQ